MNYIFLLNLYDCVSDEKLDIITTMGSVMGTLKSENSYKWIKIYISQQFSESTIIFFWVKIKNQQKIVLNG